MADEPKEPTVPAPTEPPVTPPDPIKQEWLPEDMRGLKTLEKFDGLENLAKGYVNLEKLHGGSIKIPGDDAKPEDWSAFYSKLGRPEKPEDYGIEVNLPEGHEQDKEAEGRFLKVAHDVGLTKGQAEKLIQFGITENLSQADKATTLNLASTEEARGVLREKWGATFERNEALAQRALSEFGSKELTALLEDKEFKFGNNPAVVEVFASIGRALLEDGHISGEEVGMTVDGAKSKIAEIMGDPKHAYFNGDDPGHKQAVDYMQGLHQQASAASVR